MLSSTSIDLVGPERREVGTHNERVGPAHHVDRRPPRALRVATRLVEHPIESPAELGDLGERIPACQCSSRQLRSSG
jgi:hypothetical protein